MFSDSAFEIKLVKKMCGWCGPSRPERYVYRSRPGLSHPLERRFPWIPVFCSRRSQLKVSCERALLAAANVSVLATAALVGSGALSRTYFAEYFSSIEPLPMICEPGC